MLLYRTRWLWLQDSIKHIHLWHGSSHHHFKQKLGLELPDPDDTQQKPRFDTSSHQPGAVVAPMAGMVIKVVAEEGTTVEEGQPVLVLEAMKMEVISDAS